MQKKWIIITLLLVVVAVGVYYTWTDGTSQKGKAGGFPPTVISATTVTETAWQPSLQSVGSLVATNGINVSTEVNGTVSKIVFTSGETIEQGQVLLQLDDAVDQAALEALRAEQQLAEVQFKRASNLLKKRVTSKSEYDEASARFEAARARVKQQEAIVRRKVIKAPFTGLAGIRQVDLGQYIESGNPIVSLLALDPIYADYTLPERYLGRIKTGQQVNIQLDALPSESFSGTVSAINAGVDTHTRTIKIRATLSNPQQLLRPGMFAEVETYTGDPINVLTLPKTAISFNTYGNFVFVINESDKGLTVKRTPVETGESRDGNVIVKNLQAGIQVVRTGLVKLREGAPVKIDNQVNLDDKGIQHE